MRFSCILVWLKGWVCGHGSAWFTCILVWLKGSGCVGMDQLGLHAFQCDWRGTDVWAWISWRYGEEFQSASLLETQIGIQYAHFNPVYAPWNPGKYCSNLTLSTETQDSFHQSTTSWNKPMCPHPFNSVRMHIHCTCNKTLLLVIIVWCLHVYIICHWIRWSRNVWR